jgi:hypothetical protein
MSTTHGPSRMLREQRSRNGATDPATGEDFGSIPVLANGNAIISASGAFRATGAARPPTLRAVL